MAAVGRKRAIWPRREKEFVVVGGGGARSALGAELWPRKQKRTFCEYARIIRVAHIATRMGLVARKRVSTRTLKSII